MFGLGLNRDFPGWCQASLKIKETSSSPQVQPAPGLCNSLCVEQLDIFYEWRTNIFG